MLELGEEAVVASLREWARDEGMLLSPGGAAAAAGYGALVGSGEVRESERVVMIENGSGLKYAETIAQRVHLRRPHRLPKSLPVGGIITPV